jgi:hypothetical protein
MGQKEQAIKEFAELFVEVAEKLGMSNNELFCELLKAVEPDELRREDNDGKR